MFERSTACCFLCYWQVRLLIVATPHGCVCQIAEFNCVASLDSQKGLISPWHILEANRQGIKLIVSLWNSAFSSAVMLSTIFWAVGKRKTQIMWFRHFAKSSVKTTYHAMSWDPASGCTGLALTHYTDVTMSVMASQITNVWIVCSTVCSGEDQRNHQSLASLAFVRGIHRWPVNFPHKGLVTRKMFAFDDIIITRCISSGLETCYIFISFPVPDF